VTDLDRPEGDPGSGDSVMGAGQPGWDDPAVGAVDTTVTEGEVQALEQLTGATAADPCATLAEALEKLGAQPTATSPDVAAALAAANERPVLIVDRATPQAPVYRVEQAESAQVIVVPLTGGDPAALPIDDLALAAESAQEFELPVGALAAGLTVVAVGGGLAAALAYKFASRATS
jgi:hypothetical protein